MGRLHSLLGQALACDECGLQHPDMPCEHSLHETTPTPWRFLVLFPNRYALQKKNLGWKSCFLLLAEVKIM